MSEEKQKLCYECKDEKPLTEFYKAGKYWQRRCKPCHNSMRTKYPSSNKYIAHPRKCGFRSLPEELRQNIITDMKTMDTKAVWKKYGEGNFHYHTLLIWKKEGQLIN